MNRHEALGSDLEPDKSRTVEVKVVVAALVVLLANVAYAVISAISADAHILNDLPEWARFVILAAIPPVLGFIGGYAVPSNRV